MYNIVCEVQHRKAHASLLRSRSTWILKEAHDLKECELKKNSNKLFKRYKVAPQTIVGV